MELYLKNWYDKFLDELKRTKILKVSSPFIKEQVIRKMQSQFDFKNFELITRFNLRDFASNVSSLDGLKFSVECGANIFGVRDLHSKIYLFDKRSAIITSANLTSGGMINNYECGIYITDKSTIQKIHNYFNELKRMAGQKLSLEQCKDWQQELSQVEISNTSFPSLPDYGSSAIAIDKNRNYYVKFIGTGYNREPLSFSTKVVIDKALCHYACGFSQNKKPRQIQDGDIIYMARMTINPNDYAIFGKAEAIKFVDGRDEATPQEIQERPWKKDWPIYLRIKNPIFINGTLNDCVFLYDLIKQLDYESFPSTQLRYLNGERDINPYNSLSQQPYIKLTTKAVEWLEPRFQEALTLNGKVSKRFINNLPQSQTNIETWED
jgi:hypothetical protein